MLFFIALNSKAYYVELPVIGKIKKSYDLSAISCIDLNRCLIASDEATFVQRAKIVAGSLVVSGEKVSLGTSSDENDIEGLANDGKSFYAVGSHALSRKHGKFQPSRYQFFKIDLNKNGLSVSTYSLSTVLRDEPQLKKFYKKPLDENGINIEGLAYRDGKVFLGFRGPIIDSKAQILSFDLVAFLSTQQIDSTLTSIDLGDERGVRSLEFHGELLYIVAGGNDRSLNSLSEIKSYSFKSKRIMHSYATPLAEEKLEGITFIGSGKVITIFDSLLNGNPFQVHLF